MKVLVLGGSGMLGHKLVQVLKQRYETWCTIRAQDTVANWSGIFKGAHMLYGVDVTSFETVTRSVKQVRPDVVINAIGIIKQLAAGRDPIASITINSLLPHRLSSLCRLVGARLVHVSTDCVFAGRQGMYRENDVPDPEDLYGRSKLLGEVTGDHCVTLRTSIIGRELKKSTGLLEWLLSQTGGHVTGYTDAIFSGLPTLVLAGIIGRLIARHPSLSGLYHVSADPITKYNLLCLLRKEFRVSVTITPSSNGYMNRSLDSHNFQKITGITSAPWPTLVKRLAADSKPYQKWRGQRDA